MAYQSDYELRQNRVRDAVKAVSLSLGVPCWTQDYVGNPFELEVIIPMAVFESDEAARKAFINCMERPAYFGGSGCYVRLMGGDVEKGRAEMNIDMLWAKLHPRKHRQIAEVS